MDKKKNKYDVDIPKEVLDAFARYIIPEIRRFYESKRQTSPRLASALTICDNTPV